MKSITTLTKQYDFETAQEYYDYIFESRINGQLKQARELFQAMNKEAKKDFVAYCLNWKNNRESLELLFEIAF